MEHGLTRAEERLLPHLTVIQSMILSLLSHEGEGFSARAQRVTAPEAQRVAFKLLQRLEIAVEQGGTLACDGAMLTQLLDETREDMRRVMHTMRTPGQSGL
ncbi:MAG TPA: hypothetical protein VFS21_33270 [Roseiflexaceae bacterium]|nr:hypothetical protein [Roseiflexaceae bacterium]